MTTPRREPDLAWWSKSRVLRDRTLTSERIVEAALELIDRDGLSGLSMRRLGDALKAGATSLYWHVPNKEALLDLVVDRLMAEVDREAVFDPAATWRAQLATIANALRRVLARHAGAAPLLASRMPLGPYGLRIMERMLSALDAAGFRGQQQALAYGAIAGYALGQSVLQSRRISDGVDAAAGPDGEAIDGHQRRFGGLLQSVPRTHFPNIFEQAAEIATISEEEQFDYGLQRLLDGLVSDLRPPATRRRLF